MSFKREKNLYYCQIWLKDRQNLLQAKKYMTSISNTTVNNCKLLTLFGCFNLQALPLSCIYSLQYNDKRRSRHADMHNSILLHITIHTNTRRGFQLGFTLCAMAGVLVCGLY